MRYLSDIKLSKSYQKRFFLIVLFIFLFVGLKWVILPVFEDQRRLSHKIVQKKAALKEMKIWAQKYVQISGTSLLNDKMPVFDKKTSLFSFMDNKAQESGIKGNVVYMRPFKKKANRDQIMDIVDIKLSSVYLSNLIRFLSCIESDNPRVSIRSLSLTRTGNKNGTPMLDVLMETAVPVYKKVKL